MIVVVGSRHDAAAMALVAAWPAAALCSAEDLTRPGWAWSSDGQRKRYWVVDGRVVDDACVTGVFVRRSAVYPEELIGTHPADRAYLAAEAHAFLVFALASTRAIVANPVADGAFGEESLRHERSLRAAADVGLAAAPLRLTSRTHERRSVETTVIDVVGEETFGDGPARAKKGALAMARRLRLAWATFVFDGRHRLLAVTTSRPPGPAATAALQRLLTAPVAA